MAGLKYLLQRSLKYLKKFGSRESCQMGKLLFQAKLNNQSIEETTLNITYIPYNKKHQYIQNK